MIGGLPGCGEQRAQFWRNRYDEARDEAEAYAGQLTAAGIRPNQAFINWRGGAAA